MTRAAALVAVGALLLAAALTGGPPGTAAAGVPGPGAAQAGAPAGAGVQTQVQLLRPRAPARAQTDPQPEFVQLSVGTISPSVVTSSTTALTVSGTLRNVGDRGVRDLEVRLQRGGALSGAAAVRAALDDPTGPTPETTVAASSFTTVAPSLAPGASVPFSVSVPVGAGGGLDLTTGVYPVLVNLNGEPDFGAPARLDSASFLLPVRPAPADGEPTTTPPTPTPVTLLWPLADRPRLVPVPPGQAPLLTDDTLATSFADGGRLHDLLQALDTARADDPDGALAAATCLAVDPDLLVTAEVMASPGGYQVRTGPGATTAGTGSAAATAWLRQLRTVAAGSCVVALPWAQADLDAAARAGLREVERTAVTTGGAEVARVAGTQTLPTLTWPSTGTLGTAAAADLAGLGQRTVLLPADAVTGAAGASAVRTGSGLAAVLTDPTVAQALAATGAEGVRRTGSSGVLGAAGGAVAAPGDRRAPALQDAVATVLAPLVGAEPAPDRFVVAPPQLWTVDEQEATDLLGAVQGLLTDGLLTPAPLVAVAADAAASTTTATLAPAGGVPLGATGTDDTTAAVARVEDSVSGFVAAAQADVQAQLQPADLVAPLRQGLVRSLSTTGQGPAPAEVGAALSTMLAGVSLQDPGGVFTLASEQSPLLLVLRNPLPVTVDVRVAVTGPPGLRVEDTGVQQLPAGSTRQLVLPASVGRTGQLAVDVSLSTSTGLPIGEGNRVLVRSTAYGTATLAVTAGAAALLVLLVARRLWHRFRGAPDRADEGRGRP